MLSDGIGYIGLRNIQVVIDHILRGVAEQPLQSNDVSTSRRYQMAKE